MVESNGNREMLEFSVGAVGASIVAGLVSILGLIIGKEQKVSEFRQSWINDLRKCFVDYIVNINAICDLCIQNQKKDTPDYSALNSLYKSLNEAHNGILFRLNGDEETSKLVLFSMGEFERIFQKNSSINPEIIKKLEKEFIKNSNNLLKYEWNRVKRGEPSFFITKYLMIFFVTSMVIFVIYLIKK